ncbi:MAG: PAS domain S-box protein [Deltaproteobacteria bacterium]|nr:PAS domain S-box protein [Deltaproteobacteria bacterium]MBW2597234.1 PAS domain S-box protein [Deltaproteobacteria bacterium]MBW2638946.1 PAS domain S-box protein [Deltaproteobacteria bacterium]MBW2679476.1 PAS domain S-box protein [Deltaproteobacteria bacterium]
MATLTDQELIYKQIVDFSQDGILFADRDGIIRLWNSGAETIFGYKAQEALGQSLDLIVPEKLRERHWEGYRRVMDTGKTRYGNELLKVPALKKDRIRISVEFTILLVWNHRNEILGSAAIMRDVTERWQQEKEMNERLKSLEDQLELQNNA